MKKYFLLITVMALVSQITNAQEHITKAISIGAELSIPQRSAYNIGYGFSGNAEVPVSSKVGIVVAGGYQRYSYKNLAISGYKKPDADSYIPLKAGLKYYPDPKFYTQAELGTVINNSDGSAVNLFTYSLGTGFLIPLGDRKASMIDLGLRFEDWSKNRLQQFAIRVAYRFGF